MLNSEPAITETMASTGSSPQSIPWFDGRFVFTDGMAGSILQISLRGRRLDPVTNFVLIHGTTQSPVGWGRLVGALRARGHRSWTVDLASSAELSDSRLLAAATRYRSDEFQSAAGSK